MHLVSNPRDILGFCGHLELFSLASNLADLIGAFGFVIGSIYFAANAIAFSSVVLATT